MPLAQRVTKYTLNKYINIHSLYIKKNRAKQNKNNDDTSTFFYIWTRTSGLHSNVSIFHNVNSSNAMTTTRARNNNVYVTMKKHWRCRLKLTQVTHSNSHTFTESCTPLSHNYPVTHPKLKLLKINKFTYHSNQNNLGFWIKTCQNCFEILRRTLYLYYEQFFTTNPTLLR